METTGSADVGAWDGAVAVQQVLFPGHSLARARRVRFGPPDRLSPLGEVYLQPTLTTGHWTGEGGSRERGGEKMVLEPDRFNARVAHRLRGRPRFELIKARDLESLATA